MTLSTSTVNCNDIKDEKHGSTFCTNGGTCLNMVFKGKRHGGCVCPHTFVGAHCQYLRADVKGGLVNEVIFSDVHENFWTVIPSTNEPQNQIATDAVIGTLLAVIGVFVLGMFLLAIGAVTVVRKNKVSKQRVVNDSSNLNEDDNTEITFLDL
jgi:hypothetical protein